MDADVFEEFKDPATGKFRKSLAGNSLGVLSLFEASYMLVHEGCVLQEALDFTSAYLNSVDETTGSLFITKLARHALIQHIQRGYPRLEAWRYICICQDDAFVNENVLALAKLDFNSAEVEPEGNLRYREVRKTKLPFSRRHLLYNLSGIAIGVYDGRLPCRWWKDGAFMGNLPFVRNRNVVSYLWVLGVYFEPECSAARFVTEVLIMLSLIDDMFDAYGKPEELELFTKALDRGDVSSMDGFSESMKFFYRKLTDVYNEMEEEMARRGCSYRLSYGKQSVKDHAKASITEAKWFREKYTPLLDEYIAVAATNIAVKAMAVNCLVGMGDVVTEDAFEWLSYTPHVMQSVMTASRYWHDIVGWSRKEVTWFRLSIAS
ncbi:hypothetical protein MLD38_022038 [Melastoma candidum]|uniref:Uncharacterized protein n=1 Tax=Melastoma candidum TaxID=119954 RepID=A0ACB9QHU0_9MYRT|nr:hypothetical protein MLD38_022038 [Melastoma candidum]